MSTPLTINSVETLQEALPIIRASQEAYGTFTQEQVDAICEKAAGDFSAGNIILRFFESIIGGLLLYAKDRFACVSEPPLVERKPAIENHSGTSSRWA